MPLARTQEERDIERRCKAWAFKLAGQTCYVIFHKLPRHKLGICYPGWYKIPSLGMRTFQRNVIALDIEKTKKGGYDVEELLIHECMHLKLPDHKTPHSNVFACEMKKHIGRHEWGRASKKPEEDHNGND
jgi:hypothetical protein